VLPPTLPPPPPPSPTTPPAAGGAVNASSGQSSCDARDRLKLPNEPRWHQQVNTWAKVKKKFHLDENRYNEFSYLCYLDIDDLSVQNYAKFHMGTEQINFRNRLALHLDFWKQLHTPEWLLDYINNGICIPFES
jgi:hypothetical protein